MSSDSPLTADERQVATMLADALAALCNNIGPVDPDHGYYDDWRRANVVLAHWNAIHDRPETPEGRLQLEQELIGERMDAMEQLKLAYESEGHSEWAMYAEEAEVALRDVLIGIQELFESES